MKWEKDIDENVRSGLIELLMLRLLSERDMYGYEIRKALLERTNGAFNVIEAALYGPLYRLKKRGLIEDRRVSRPNDKRDRVYYSINDEGREYLAYGLRQIDFVFSGVWNLIQGEEGNDGEQNG